MDEQLPRYLSLEFCVLARRRHNEPPVNRVRDTAVLYYSEAAQLINDERHYKAIKLLTEAVQDFPRDFMLHHELGKECSKVGQMNRAIRHLEIAHSLDPNDVIALCQLGKAFRINRQPIHAEETLFAALNLDFEDPRTFFGLGKVYEKAKGKIANPQLEMTMARGCFGYGAIPARNLYEKDVPNYKANNQYQNIY